MRNDNIAGVCATCHWFGGDREGNLELGSCHYDSPATSGFPPVYPDVWCGDHEYILRNDDKPEPGDKGSVTKGCPVPPGRCECCQYRDPESGHCTVVYYESYTPASKPPEPECEHGARGEDGVIYVYYKEMGNKHCRDCGKELK